MQANLRKVALRIALVVLLIFLAAAPITVTYLPSVLGPKLSLGQSATAYDFGSAQEESLSPTVLLAYAGVAGNAVVHQGNYTEAHIVLASIGSLPPNMDNNLKTYVTLMQELVSILASAKQGLAQLQDMITAGAVDQAHEKVRELEGLMTDASRLLNETSAALDRIEEIYGIDVSTQRTVLEGLSRTLQGLEQLLTKLGALLKPQDLRAATRLDLSASPQLVKIGGTLHVTAQLNSGDNPLPDRVVDLWVSGYSTRLTLDQEGAVKWGYDVSTSKLLDSLELYAQFTPTGKDASIYRPVRSANQTVAVEYYPVALTLASSSNKLHVLENFTAQAKLLDTSARGLVQQNVEFVIDNSSIGTCMTDGAGECSIAASLATGTPEGTHDLYARFDPTQGTYASASSEKTGIEVYYLKPTINLIALSGVAKVSGDDFAVSGQTLYVQGRLEVDSAPLAEGLVVALLGERELARASSGSDGVFRIAVNIPLDTTGDQTLSLVSHTEKSWILSSTTSLVLKIVNSPIVFLSLGAICAASIVLSGRSLGLRSMFRRPRESEEDEEAEIEPKAEAKEEAATAPIEFKLEYLKHLDDSRTCLRETYWETRGVLAALLNDNSDRSETHREYEKRMSGRLSAGAAKSFSALTGLFELAEYSQHPLSRVEADEAINHAVLIAETMNVEVKK